MIDPSIANRFREGLFEWKEAHPRPMPWKGEKDPYAVWLSEVILQQTRVAQGLPYFEKFKDRFPDIKSLAGASDDEVYKLWEGLGYYSRARNMLETARALVRERDGRFPETYAGLLSLKGVGPYTAAAIASFAYGLPHAVVDGNVFRVLARVFGIETPSDSTEGKHLFAEWARFLLPEEAPAAYNQAIMDFGALQCKPAQPNCSVCPFQSFCIALQTKKVDQLPVKAKKIAQRVRYFNYLNLSHGGKILLRKRTDKDIWQNLHDFPLFESEEPESSLEQVKNSAAWASLFPDGADVRFVRVSKPYSQKLTHQQIVARFWEFDSESPLPEGDAYFAQEQKKLLKFAVPKIVDWYLKDKSLYLEL